MWNGLAPYDCRSLSVLRRILLVDSVLEICLKWYRYSSGISRWRIHDTSQYKCDTPRPDYWTSNFRYFYLVSACIFRWYMVHHYLVKNHYQVISTCFRFVTYNFNSYWSMIYLNFYDLNCCRQSHCCLKSFEHSTDWINLPKKPLIHCSRNPRIYSNDY